MPSRKLSEREKEDLRIQRALTKQEELTSILIEEDLRKRELKIKREESEEKKVVPKAFYRNFVMRCKKCLEEFEHGEKSEKPLERIECPSCHHVHLVKVNTREKHYEVKFPDTLELRKK